MTHPLPPGSYAYCSDCTWRDETPTAHVNGQLHTRALGHIVHVWEQDVCGDPMVSTFGQMHNCDREPGHPSTQRHRCAAHGALVEWD
jgi:hypothetical protein